MFVFHFAASYSIKGKVDIHIESGYVYYTDNSTYTSYKGINRIKTDGGYHNMVIRSGVGKFGIQGLAVDWIAGMNPLNQPLSLQGSLIEICHFWENCSSE